MFFRRRQRPPAAVAAHLGTDRRAPAVALVGERWAAVGRAALVVVGQDGVELSLPFHAIQHVSWQEEKGRWQVRLVDPQLVPLDLVPATSEIDDFARALVDAVEHATVYSLTRQLGQGRWVRVTVRQDEAGRLAVDAVGTAQPGVDDAAVAAVVRQARGHVGMDT
ncbi:hypothetical protein [Buchananella hordeovulneris]|uniref:hypothetical protein n=1 Tax=Buchananella hordeovulneris TaxID=52770 RepID=UPI0011610BDC|nr:hypothetical protein [Buchananella hordeovulneris]